MALLILALILKTIQSHGDDDDFGGGTAHNPFPDNNPERDDQGDFGDSNTAHNPRPNDNSDSIT